MTAVQFTFVALVTVGKAKSVDMKLVSSFKG